MSSTVTEAAAQPDGGVRSSDGRRPRQVFGGALRSEWTKLRTLRSTYWTLLAAIVVTVGFAALTSWGITTAVSQSQVSAQAKDSFPVVFLSFAGVGLGLLALAALGALFISSEYGTGMIRSTLVAVPQRLRVLLAKLLVLAAVTFIVGEIAAFASFFVGQAFFATQDMAVSLGDDGVLRAVIGAGLYMMAAAVFGLAVGALIRNTPASITAAIGGLLVLPGLTSLLPGDWGEQISKYFLTNPGQEVMRLSGTNMPAGMSGGMGASASTSLGPWVGLGVFAAEIAFLLVIGAVLLATRDA